MPDAAAKELAPEPDVFAQDALHAIRINDEFTVDVLPAVAGLSWDQLKPHIVSKEIDGVTLRLLDLQGLLRTKHGVRPKDQMDAVVLRAALAALGQLDQT